MTLLNITRAIAFTITVSSSFYASASIDSLLPIPTFGKEAIIIDINSETAPSHNRNNTLVKFDTVPSMGPESIPVSFNIAYPHTHKVDNTQDHDSFMAGSGPNGHVMNGVLVN